METKDLQQQNPDPNPVACAPVAQSENPQDDALTQRIIKRIQRLDRERKDWKKCAKSLFVCLSKQRKQKPKQKKLLEKYIKLKNKYKDRW